MRSIYTLLLILLSGSAVIAQPGLLDSSFGQNGIFSMSGTPSASLACVAIDNQGRTLIASSFGGNLHINRLNSSGQLDATFGASGTAIVNYALSAVVEDILIQPDGKIVLGGSVGLVKDADPLVVRLGTDGRLDRTFGTSGTFRFQALNNNFDQVRELGIMSDGSIIALVGVGAQASATPGPDNYENLLVFKLNASGTQDMNFAGTGYWNTNWLSTGWDRSSDMLIQPDDKIVIPSTVPITGVGERVHAFRLNPNGILDSLGFGTIPGETNLFRIGSDLKAVTSGIGVQSSGKLIVAGTYGGFVLPKTDFFAMRLNADGSADSTFGSLSATITDFFGDSEVCYDLVMQGDEFLLVGEADSAGTPGMAIARYSAHGKLDSTFGTNGLAFFANAGMLQEAALMANGTIMAAGISGTSAIVAAIGNHSAAGLEKFKSDLSISVSPNPFNDYLEISFNLKKADKITLEIQDMSGKLVSNQFTNRRFDMGENTVSVTLPPNLENGLYLLKMQGKSAAGINKILRLSN